MKVYVGDCRGRKMIEMLKGHGWGRVVITMAPKPFENEEWILDSGAYSDFLHKRPFNEKRFTQRMHEAERVREGTMAAVVVPDRVGEGNDSLKFSHEWLMKIPVYHTKWLVLQDGMEESAVMDELEWYDGLFLGGTTKFKTQARKWCDFAHKHDKTFHYGRAGTLKKVQHAYDVGADSIDSSFPLWTYERFGRFVDAVNGDVPQARFDFVKAFA